MDKIDPKNYDPARLVRLAEVRDDAHAALAALNDRVSALRQEKQRLEMALRRWREAPKGYSTHPSDPAAKATQTEGERLASQVSELEAQIVALARRADAAGEKWTVAGQLVEACCGAVRGAGIELPAELRGEG